ncbi:MAG: DUF2786 domain-containing protein [Pseudorhodobacter sp.]|nr:DUF2786 domain-containing protein [Frankiaceae bacterium]
MGVNNKQRRAARKKGRRQDRPTGPARGGDPFEPEGSLFTARSAVVRALNDIVEDKGGAGEHAGRLLRPDGPVPPSLVREALTELLAELTASVVAHGWLPSDLAEICARRLSARHLSQLIALLGAQADRHPQARMAPAWRADLMGLGLGAALDLRTLPGLQAGLELASCLAVLPPITVLLPAPGRSTGPTTASHGGDVKVLAKVRSLLAKAESTDFPDEAELLSAKAQELISRHALDRLLAETDSRDASAAAAARRIWIEAPYVFPKAMLVAAVAEANRCRAIVSDDLGFCTVVGQDRDLALVDLLVTSLLVQAGGAMLRAGRHTDGRGTSRTRSFRQSFLVAYAGRVGERLQTAADDAVTSTGRSGELVPVLRQRAGHVDAAVHELFPHQTSKQAHVNNAQGWAAGRAAAHFARLDTHAQVVAAAG